MLQLLAASGLAGIGIYAYTQVESRIRAVIEKIIPPFSNDDPGLILTVPIKQYGPPVPPTLVTKTNSLNGWNLLAIAAVILAVGYTAKNIGSFFR